MSDEPVSYPGRAVVLGCGSYGMPISATLRSLCSEFAQAGVTTKEVLPNHFPKFASELTRTPEKERPQLIHVGRPEHVEMRTIQMLGTLKYIVILQHWVAICHDALKETARRAGLTEPPTQQQWDTSKIRAAGVVSTFTRRYDQSQWMIESVWLDDPEARVTDLRVMLTNALGEYPASRFSVKIARV